MKASTQKRIAAYIAEAQGRGSTATTFKGAGRFRIEHTYTVFYTQNCALEDPDERRRYPYFNSTPRISREQRRNERLIRRFAGVNPLRLPKYLNRQDRATINTSAANLDIRLFRLTPSFARAFRVTDALRYIPRFAKEIAAAEKEKGELVSNHVIASDAQDRVDWGRLRVHQPGRSVMPNHVGIRVAVSSGCVGRRSTLRRYADYSLVTPAQHGEVWTEYYVDPNREIHTVFRTRHWMRIDQDKPLRAPRAYKDAPPLPLHVQHRILALACPRVLRIEHDRSRNQGAELMLVDHFGEQYHVGRIYCMYDAREAVRRSVQALQKRRAEKIDAEQLRARAAMVFVGLEDSYRAGNCESMSDRFARQMWDQISAEGPCAVRGDLILAARNDEYTRRAISFAMTNHERN